MVNLMARTRVFPTEDEAKVLQALSNLFPEGVIEKEGDDLVCRSAELDEFKELIRRDRILDATRVTMLKGIVGNSTTFSLNKQVAVVGKVSMAEGDPPLGKIIVTIEADDIEKEIDVIAPRTVDGEEVS
jgi:predicted RNA binding protein with dsRBD fold (UPF0201 family)